MVSLTIRITNTAENDERQYMPEQSSIIYLSHKNPYKRQ